MFELIYKLAYWTIRGRDTLQEIEFVPHYVGERKGYTNVYWRYSNGLIVSNAYPTYRMVEWMNK